jgi:O-antigen/teichoic acid export membrane protein
LIHRLVTSLVWLGSASLVAQIVSWLSTLLVIRLLSPEDYGLMAMAGLSIGVFMVLGDLGVGVVVIQTPTLDQGRLRALFGACLLLHLAGAALVFLSAPLVAAFFGDPGLVALVRALSLCLVCIGLYALPQALLARELQFARKASVDVLAIVTSAVVAVGLAMSGWGVWSLVGAVVTTHAFRAVAFQLLRPCLFFSFPSWAALRDSAGFAGWVALDRLLWFGYSSLDIAIAGRVLGGAVLGVYSVALSLAALPLDKVMSIVNEVSLPAVSRIQEDRELLRRGVLRALESVSLLAFPTFFGMAAVAPEMVAVVLGSRWAPAVLPLQILCLVFPFRALGLLFAPVLFGSGRPRLVVENNALTLASLAVALGLGVQWGIVGLCVGWVAGYVPMFCLIAHRTLAVLGIPTRQMVGTIAFSLVTALVMAGAVTIARTFVEESLPPVGVLTGLVLVGIGVYGTALAAFRPAILRAFWTLTRTSAEDRAAW